MLQTQEEVMMVNDNFNMVDVPLDMIWLDIDHTFERQYVREHM